MRTLKEIFTDKESGEFYEDCALEELTYICKEVWEGNYDERRWYTLFERVVEVPDGDNPVRYFKYTDVKFKDSLGTRYEAGMDKLTLKDFVEVYPKQVLTTVFTTTKQ